MFLHIGNSKIIFNNNLIGIFNFDANENYVNHKVLENASFDAINNNVKGNDRPKSFIVTDKNVFISPISPLTLSKRYNSS
ncbi:MAG: DUF370 domain-containing protein [Bacillota bacterium]